MGGGYVCGDEACGNRVRFKPHKIRIFGDLWHEKRRRCHPFATLILIIAFEHENRAESVELSEFQSCFW